MKSVFREFFYKEEIDFRNLKDDTLIVFDTNVLLNIYRYSNSTRTALLDALSLIQDNIWIPYQVGLEFNLDRRMVIDKIKNQREKVYLDVQSHINKLFDSVDNTVNQSFTIRSSDGVDKKNRFLRDFRSEFKENMDKFIKKELMNLDDMINKESDRHDEIANLFDGKVGECYNQEQLDEILEDAEERFEKDIPPGYEDKRKKGKRIYNGIEFENKFGDLVLWKQILDRADDQKIKKVIFITDDGKKDWWFIENSKKIGPKAELKREMLNETNSDLFMIDTNSFLSQVDTKNIDLIDTSNSTTLNSDEFDLNNDRNFIDAGLKKTREDSWTNEIEDINVLEKDTFKRINNLESQLFNLMKMIHGSKNSFNKKFYKYKDSKYNITYLQEIEVIEKKLRKLRAEINFSRIKFDRIVKKRKHGFDDHNIDFEELMYDLSLIEYEINNISSAFLMLEEGAFL